MTTQHIVAFILFAFVAAVTPGPSNIILTSVGANAGVVRGFALSLRGRYGDGVHDFPGDVGSGECHRRAPRRSRCSQVVGIALLLWLSWKIATAGLGTAGIDQGESSASGRRPRCNGSTPNRGSSAASAVATYLPAESAGAFGQALWFGIVFFLAALPGCFVWLAFGAAVQRFLQSERAARGFNVAMGALLAGSIVLFIR